MNIKKPLIATIVYNSNTITNDCFLKSLYKTIDENLFDLLIVTTSDTEFILDDNYKKYTNIILDNFNKKYLITTHAAAIQQLLDIYKNKYSDIIICENDVIIKKNLLTIIDHTVSFVGQDSHNIKHNNYWTRLYSKLHLGCRRYMPMLMYFNVDSFPNKNILYEKYDCSLNIKIPSLDIQLNLQNTWLCDPGWYFLLWTEKNNIQCKTININDYISHFWYGCENRNSQFNISYTERLNKFKEDNKIYL